MAQNQELPSPLSSMLRRYFECTNTRRVLSRERGLANISTGFSELDAALDGHEGMTFVAGESGVGKTSLVLQTSAAAMLSDPRVGLVYCYYDSGWSIDLVDQMLCILGACNMHALSHIGTREETERLNLARKVLGRLAERIQFIGRDALDRHPRGLFGWYDRWRNSVEDLRQNRGVHRVITVIDRLQRMPVPPVGKLGSEDGLVLEERIENSDDAWRLEQVGQAYGFSMSQEFKGWPFFLISELRKGEASRRGPEVVDLLGSAALGYDATRVLLVHPAGEAKGDVVPTNIIIAKARRGRKLTMPVSFRFPQCRFDEFQMPDYGIDSVLQAKVDPQPNPKIDIFAGR